MLAGGAKKLLSPYDSQCDVKWYGMVIYFNMHIIQSSIYLIIWNMCRKIHI